MKVGALRTTDAMASLISNIQKNEIDIACEKATRKSRNVYLEQENYAIFLVDKTMTTMGTI